MKNIVSVLLLALVLMGGVALFAPDAARFSKPIDLGPLLGGGMENPGARKDWERRRLMDPATGRVPSGIRSLELAFADGLPTDAFLKTDSLTSPWTLRGPWNLGGRTRAFAMDMTNPDVLMAGGVSGGIWRSADGGANWTKITLPGAHPGVNHIVQDTRAGHTSTWYALSGEAYGTSASGGEAFFLGSGMSKSTDGGLTWSILSATNSGTPQSFDNVWDATWNLAINPADTVQDVVYCAVLGAIMRSTNGGTSWTRVRGSTSTNLSYFTNVMTTPSGVVYATLSSFDGGGTNLGTEKGIWRSTDGVTWTNISPSFMPTSYRRIVSAYNPQNENRLYFLASSTDPAGKRTEDFMGRPEYNSLWRYTYLSGNGSGAGGYWENLSENIPASGGPFDEFISQGSYNLVAAVHPVDTNVVIIGGTNLYRSTTAFNDSLNTTHIGGYEVGAGAPLLYNGLYPNQHPDHHVLFFHPSNPNTLYNANDGGLFKTSNVMDSSVAWTELNNGYHVSQFYTVAIDHGTSGSDVIVGGLQDNGSWFATDATPTNPWKWTCGGDGSYCHIADGGSTYYFSKQSGVIAKCTVDAGGNVTGYERIDPIGASGHEFINPFVIDPNNQNRMYLPAGRKIWMNSDLSAIPINNGWDSITTNWSVLTDTVPGSLTITAISACKTPTDRLYIGTDNKNIYRIDNASSGSPVMTSIAGTALPASGYVSCLAVNPTNGDEVVAVYSNYSVYSIWHSSDAGSTWVKAAGNLEATSTGTGNGPSVRWVEILPFAGGNYYLAATSTGLYGTDSLAGISTVWTQLGASTIGKSVVNMIKHRQSDGRTVIATHGFGIWSATFTGPPPVAVKPSLPSLVTLQIYPNPAKGHARMKLELPETDELVGSLWSQNGQKVAEYQLGNLSAGTHSFDLDLQSLAPGLYFVRVEGRGWNKAVKLLRQ